MIQNSIHAFIGQVMQWFKSYQQMYETINPPALYRIIDIYKNRYRESRLTVQRIGKSTIFECSPLDIAQDERLYESFSKQDVRTITFLAQQLLNAPKYTIVAQIFGEARTIFRLEKIGKSDYIEKTAADIIKDKDLLESLSSRDAQIINYVSAYEKTHDDFLKCMCPSKL